jgi:hypothetical protein
MFKFSKPKFRKHSAVITPNGSGVIIMISFEQGINWYGVKLDSNKVTKFYAETEVKLV